MTQEAILRRQDMYLRPEQSVQQTLVGVVKGLGARGALVDAVPQLERRLKRHQPAVESLTLAVNHIVGGGPKPGPFEKVVERTQDKAVDVDEGNPPETCQGENPELCEGNAKLMPFRLVCGI